MKTTWFLLGASSLLLFSGCFSSAGTPKDGDLPKDPAKTFQELTTQHREAWSKDIFAKISDDFFAAEKYRSHLQIDASAQIAAAGGSATLSFSVSDENDLSDSKNPKSTGDLSLMAEMMGIFSGKTSLQASYLIANKSAFFSLKDFSLDFPNVPASQIVDPLKPIFGKWYGNTFEEIGKLMGVPDISESIPQVKTPVQIQKELEAVLKKRNLWIMKSAEPAKEGGYVFQVELDKAELQAAVGEIALAIGVNEEEKKNIEEDIAREMQDVTVTGELWISAKNPKYFQFSGIVKNKSEEAEITLLAKEEEQSFSLKQKQGGEHVMGFLKHEKDEKYTFEVSGGENKDEDQKLITGSGSEEQMTVSIMDPDSQKAIVRAEFQEKADKWSGIITVVDENVTIELSDVVIDDRMFSGKLLVKQEKADLGNLTWSYTMKEDKSISIAPPSSFEPLQNLVLIIQQITGRAFAPSAPASLEGGELSEEEMKQLMNKMEDGDTFEMSAEVVPGDTSFEMQ